MLIIDNTVLLDKIFKKETGMKILAVDDEKLGLETLVSAITKSDDSNEVFGFRKAQDAIDFVKENKVDVAFLDIQLRGTNGVDLAKKLKAIYPKINIVFATGYDIYQQDAFKMHASGYILKPINKEKVKLELDNLRNPVEPEILDTNKLVARTFGSFELFFDGKPIKFKYDKSKELMALLVDARGSLLSNGQIMAYLWEDDNHESYLRGLKKDITDTLKSIDMLDSIVIQRGKIGVDLEMIDCDYYQYLDGVAQAINCYMGEYMNQYSWAEETNAKLSDQLY